MRQAIQDEQVWNGAELAARTDWRFAVSGDHWAEIKNVTKRVAATGKTWRHVSSENFLVPGTEALLSEIAAYLEHGPGVASLTGFQLDELSADERRIMFYGLGQTLGTPVSMSLEGMMMSDVTNEGDASGEKYGQAMDQNNKAFLSSRARVHSTGQLRFHNDRCDVVALLCVHPAASGGVSRLASVPMIHNRMLASRPDLLELLFENFDRSRLGEEFGPDAKWYSIPIFATHQGFFTSHYSRTFIEAAQEHPAVAMLTDAHWEAIDMLHEIADEVAFEVPLQRGEIQLLNNHVVFHGRTQYADPPGASARLLHRLWLSMPNSRPLPESFRVLFGDVRAGAERGGIPKRATP